FPREGETQRSSLRFFNFWEISDVNLFPHRGGNCAQVVRRGWFGTDPGTAGLADRPHPDGQSESEVHAVSGYRRSCDCHQRRQGVDDWHDVGTEKIAALHWLSGRLTHGRLPHTICAE